MKQTESTIGRQAEFDAAVSFQAKPLTIAGDAELIVELHTQAEQAVKSMQSHKLASPVIKAVTEPENAPQPILEGRKATIAAKTFDLFHRTDLLGELQERRRAEKVLDMKLKLGLLSTDRCAKHERLLAKV